MSGSDAINRLNAVLEGRYRIERELGQGGMATVYLTDDLRHGRKVALKVLRPELAAVLGAERFLAEIQTTANLQHPHILPLFDSGEADGSLFYVMPYVEGESLRQKLDREHQLQVDDAVRIVTAVANALDYAHRQGVIHRDIKPANILLHDGEPVVADFGIALAVNSAAGHRLTETGLSLGTPQYMSPEQATGDPHVGSTTDVWALGCVLYEMLVGEPPYTGTTPQAILGRSIAGAAPPPSAERPSVPASVDAAIGKALEKLPADRFTGAKGFAQALADPGFRHGATATAVPRRRMWNVPALGVGALVGGLTVGIVGWLAPPPREPQDALSINLPPDVALLSSSRPAVSPDGRIVAFVAAAPGGEDQLHLRRLEDFETTVVRGSDGARDPFFSPDGRSVAFFTPTALLTAPVSGGPPLIVCPSAPGDRDGTWTESNTIVFVEYGSESLVQVPASGGEPIPLRTLDASAGEITHDRPQALPGGGILYGVYRAPPLQDEIRILYRGESRTVWSGASQARYGNGRILFVDGASLFSVAFDLDEATTAGEPVPILDDLLTVESYPFDIAADGTIVYVPESSPSTSPFLMRVSRDGDAELVPTPIDWNLRNPKLSPVDSTMLLFESFGDVWTFDLASRTPYQVTLRGGSTPRWTTDGRRVVYRSPGPAPHAIFTKSADGRGEPERIAESQDVLWPDAVTPDGETLVLGRDPGVIMTMPLDGSDAPRPLIEEEFMTWSLGLSPDGRWLVYVSNQTGRVEVYVTDFPDGSGRWRISSQGGTEPTWSPLGDELFYRDENRMLAVPVLPTEPGAAFRWDSPYTLFEGPYRHCCPGLAQYTVAADAQSFFMIQGGEAREIRVLQAWEDLGR